MKFTELGLVDELLEALGYMGFENATEIQEMAIPQILEGKDMIACAQTGTGKTAAFILPILNKLSGNTTHEINTLVICPTRELALQIDKQIQGFAYFLGLDSIAIYGGTGGADFEKERRALEMGSDIVVATPGKLISHLNMGHVNIKNLKHLILDEADRMLDIGFHDDIMKIIKFLPKDRQNLMFSATMAPKIRAFAKEILFKPIEISLAIAKPAEGVLQGAYVVNENQKIGLLTRLIKDKPNYKSILVFSSTKKKVSVIVRELARRNIAAKGISSNLEQKDREAVLKDYKSKKTRVLVATDVISRGIDIKDINLVVNYDVPGDAADYVHRIGRTARADTTGVGLTFITEEDMYKFINIETLIEQSVPKLAVPKELGDTPTWNPNAKKTYKSRGGGSSNHKRSGKGRNRNWNKNRNKSKNRNQGQNRNKPKS